MTGYSLIRPLAYIQDLLALAPMYPSCNDLRLLQDLFILRQASAAILVAEPKTKPILHPAPSIRNLTFKSTADLNRQP